MWLTAEFLYRSANCCFSIVKKEKKSLLLIMCDMMRIKVGLNAKFCTVCSVTAKSKKLFMCKNFIIVYHFIGVLLVIVMKGIFYRTC